MSLHGDQSEITAENERVRKSLEKIDEEMANLNTMILKIVCIIYL